MITRRVNFPVLLLLIAGNAGCAAQDLASDDTCLEITLTGTQGGPPAVNGLAGAGTLVRYGSDSNDCNDLRLQFDVGRGTTERLSQLGLSTRDIDAVFLTHVHSDHTEGLPGLLQNRWHFLGESIDVICATDVTTNTPPPERTISCRGLVEHATDSAIYSGEIAQRYAENRRRDPAGPSSLVRLHTVQWPRPNAAATIVWQSGDVTVSAVSTTHMAGSLAFRVDSPVGSVVIGGDAGNSKRAPPRESSTSEAVEALAAGADVLVHSAIHPVFAPGAGSAFPAPIYLRQSNVRDLGALAARLDLPHLVLTHLIPALDSPLHGPFPIPGGPLNESDFRSATRESGFGGQLHVGRDLHTIRLP